VLPNGRIVKPAGTSIQIGMNPLGSALTPDGKYLITSNDDEREGGFTSLQAADNVGWLFALRHQHGDDGSCLHGEFQQSLFIGLQVTGSGPYTVWAAGGPDNDVKLYSVQLREAIGQIVGCNLDPSHLSYGKIDVLEAIRFLADAITD
jgi:hypothetical protein